MSRLQEFIKKAHELQELTSGIGLYKWGKVSSTNLMTPALITIKNNNVLPSYENLPAGDTGMKSIISLGREELTREDIMKTGHAEPIKGLLQSLSHLYKAHSAAEWISGLVVVPFLNTIQLAILTVVEFGIRSAGAAFMQPGQLLNNFIDRQEEMNPALRFGLRVLVNTLTSPLKCIGITFSAIADVLAYSRQLIDASIRLCNPLWWIVHLINLAKTDKFKCASVKSVTTTFAFSLLKLAPVAALVTTSIITGGAALAVTALVKIGGVGFTSLVGTYAIAAAAMTCKLISGIANGITRVLMGEPILSKRQQATQRETHIRKDSTSHQHKRQLTPRPSSTAAIRQEIKRETETKIETKTEMRVVVTPAEIELTEPKSTNSQEKPGTPTGRTSQSSQSLFPPQQLLLSANDPMPRSSLSITSSGEDKQQIGQNGRIDEPEGRSSRIGSSISHSSNSGTIN